MMASWLIMLIALPLFGIVVGGFVLIVLAIGKGRGGAAILSGIVGIVGLMFLAALMYAFLGMPGPAQVATQVFDNGDNYQIDAGPWAVNDLPLNNASSGWVGNPGNAKTTWNISLAPLLFIVCGGVALMVLALKRGFGHACAGGHGRIWPAFLALPVIAIFMLGGIGYRTAQNVSPPRVAVSQARAHVTGTPSIKLKPQKNVAKSQVAYSSRTTKQIDQKDIHELMDEFDAPRIVLKAPIAAVTSPVAMIVVTLPATIEIPGTIAAIAVDDPEVKSLAKSVNALWSKLKRSPKSSNPFANAPEAVTASEAVAEVPPVAPAPPTPPAPSATPPVKTIVVAENRIATSSDMKADFQFAVANTAQNDRFSPPAWTKEPPKKTGDTRREVIMAGPYATAEECYRAADVYLLLKTYDHVRQLQDLPYQEAELPSVTFSNGMILADGKPFATGKTNPAWMDFRPSYLRSLGIGVDYIRRNLIAKDPKNKNETREYLETIDSSVGPMQQVYMQLEFTPSVDKEIKQVLDAAQRQDRFKVVGLGAGSVLGMLSMVWGLLKLDTATKGYYSKWLFLGVPAAIIGVTLMSMLVVA
jgi:hypothetical protein